MPASPRQAAWRCPDTLRAGPRSLNFLVGPKTRRARTHGFLVRMKTKGGRKVINARRAKGRKRLAV